MNICRECKFYQYSRFGDYCNHPALIGPPDAVHGGRKSANPRSERSAGPCGPSGNLFQPREQERCGWRGWVGLAGIFVLTVIFLEAISK